MKAAGAFVLRLDHDLPRQIDVAAERARVYGNATFVHFAGSVILRSDHDRARVVNEANFLTVPDHVQIIVVVLREGKNSTQQNKGRSKASFHGRQYNSGFQ